MESNDKDIFRQLFAGMPDEVLSMDFNEKVMRKVRVEAALREKKRKYLEVFGYITMGIVMMAVGALILYYFDISIVLPSLDLRNWSFPKPDYELFTSQSFLFSVYIGVLALFLLIIDSTIRRYIEKNKKEPV